LKDDPRIGALDRLNDRLERLLDGIERPGPVRDGDDALATAWSECAIAFEGVRAALETTEGREQDGEVRARLQTALSLHAVAASLAQRSREEVESGLGTLADVRKRLRQAGGTRSTGASCDVSG